MKHPSTSHPFWLLGLIWLHLAGAGASGTTAYSLHLETHSLWFPSTRTLRDASSQTPPPGPPQHAGTPQAGPWVLLSPQGVLSFWRSAGAPRICICVSNPDLFPKHTPRYPAACLSPLLGWVKDTKSVHPNIPPQPQPAPSPGFPIAARVPVSIQ